MTGYIYILICPIKNEPIYVGATKRPLEDRLKEHVALVSKKSSSLLYSYLGKNNVIPTIEVVEEVQFEKKSILDKREIEWIKKMSNRYPDLLNCKNNTKPCVMLKINKDLMMKVKYAVIGTNYSIGSFYDEAVEDKLKKLKN